MGSLIQSLRRSQPPAEQQRDGAPLTVDNWLGQWYGYNGLDYMVSQSSQTLGEKQEEIGGDFRGYIEGAYKSNGVIFACMAARMLLFSEARFQFRQLRSGRPGDLFGTQGLGLLERPWPGGTTGDLLNRMIQDVDLAGNAFVARVDRDRLARLRPDWVTIVRGSRRRASERDPAWASDTEVIGYVYHPGGPYSGEDPEVFLPGSVAHFAPIPDPAAVHRGMSWLTPVIGEIMGDKAATQHKLQFFENGATPNLSITFDPSVTPEKMQAFIDVYEDRHRGMWNAYETLFLGGGADTKVIGADMRQIDFKVTQGHGETRIAAAARIPPVIVGLSEGLEAATYSNYGQARRAFADGTMRPLWRNAAGSLASLIDVPQGAELWYDDRDIPFLQEDRKDAAEIQQMEAATIRSLIEAGFQPDAVVSAVTAGDLNRLGGAHTGLVPVQLQPPGAEAPAADAAAAEEGGRSLNGDGARLLERFARSSS